MNKKIYCFFPKNIAFRLVLIAILTFITIQVKSQKKLNAENLDDAIGVIMFYDQNNKLIGQGGCFCVDENGTMYSNYKFFKNCHHADVRLGNGETYKVNRIFGASETKDLAKFQVKKIGSQPLPFLEIEKKQIKKGIDAVAVFPSFNSNFMDKFSHGYIYKVYTDDIDGCEKFKADKSTPVLIGGAPILNAYGKVIGITSKTNTQQKNEDLVDWAIAVGEFEKIKQVNLVKFTDESQALHKNTIYLNSPIVKNDVSVFIDDIFVGTPEKSFEGEIPECNTAGTLSVDLPEGTHRYFVLEHSSGSVWAGEFNTAKTENCNKILISNSTENMLKKANPQNYDENGISMNKPIDINQNNTSTNNTTNPSGSTNTNTNTRSNRANTFDNYFRFDMGFEHQNFMAHGGWPTYAASFQFEKNFEGSPFSRNYRISVGMNDSAQFYLHMPAGPLAGVLLLLVMNSQQNYCSGIAASTLLFILPDGFGFSPIKNEKMEFGIYANFLGIDICQTNRRKPDGKKYSPIDYAPDFGVRYNHYFGKQFYLYSRLSAKYSTIFAGWGAQGTIGIGFEFQK